jgi:hypothetical protein
MVYYVALLLSFCIKPKRLQLLKVAPAQAREHFVPLGSGISEGETRLKKEVLAKETPKHEAWIAEKKRSQKQMKKHYR